MKRRTAVNLFAFGLLWLALPALALAGDCPDDSGAYCYVKWAAASPALAMAAGAIILGAALWGAMSGPSEPPPPHRPTPEEESEARKQDGAQRYRRYKEAAEAMDRGEPGAEGPFRAAERDLADYNSTPPPPTPEEITKRWLQQQEQGQRDSRTSREGAQKALDAARSNDASNDGDTTGRS